MAANIVLKNVEIFLENDRKVFQMDNGEKVHGKLLINFTGELPLSSLQIGIVSMCKVLHSDSTYDQKKLFEAFYKLPNSETKVLRSGNHSINFTFPLPESSETPPSFDGRYAALNHFVECLIEEDELHRTGVEIKLQNPVRNNLQLSVSGSSEKDLGLFCIGSGNVTIEATISRKGQLSGEIIPIMVRIQNLTTLKVQPRATLYQTSIFMSGEKHRTLELALGETQYGSEVDPNDAAEEVIEVLVPVDVQMTMKTSIVTVKYFVHVTLSIPHNIDLHINLPVVLTNKCALLASESAQELATDECADHPCQTSTGSGSTKHRKSKTKRTTSNDHDHSTGSSNADTD